MPPYALPFEKPIIELEKKLQELQNFSKTQNIDVSLEVDRMQKKIDETRRDIYQNLTPWQRVQVSRHPLRPYALDYIRTIATDFVELHGDRGIADDRAIIGGFARMGGQPVMFIGTQKGRDTKSNLECNFGCPYPEGYRKALRLMKLAAKFGTPIISLIDTPGAFPGIVSEERHIAEAIAYNIHEMFSLPVPMIVTIIGEGGSGGALGIGVGDRVLILEFAYYSVISPEGCAAILWKDRAYADRAAAALKLTSKDLLHAGLVDEIIPEPPGGAHSNVKVTAETLRQCLFRNIQELRKLNPEELLSRRYNKFRAMGVFEEGEPPYLQQKADEPAEPAADASVSKAKPPAGKKS